MFGANKLLAIGGLVAACLCVSPSARADSPMEAGLLEITGKSVKLNKGGRDGVVVGQIFDLYQDAKVYMLPLTNGQEPLVQSQRRVARVQVVKTEPSTSVANLISAFFNSMDFPSPDGSTSIVFGVNHIRSCTDRLLLPSNSNDRVMMFLYS